MSDAGGTEETTDYSKMKVNDLKKLLKNRGLSITGNKQELVERLQTSEASAEDLLDGSEVGDELVEDEDLERELKFLEKDESSLIDDSVIDKSESKKDTPEKEGQEVVEEPGSTSPTKVPVSSDSTSKTIEEKTTNGADSEEAEISNTTQQKRKINLKSENTTGSEATKKKLRAERFGSQGPTEVLAKRAERFAINSTTTSTAVSDRSKVSHNDTMKKRAERFGILSPAEVKRLHLEKLQARKLRFSSAPDTIKEVPNNSIATTTTVTPDEVTAGAKTTDLSVEQRKQLRAQRFKIK